MVLLSHGCFPPLGLIDSQGTRMGFSVTSSVDGGQSLLTAK